MKFHFLSILFSFLYYACQAQVKAPINPVNQGQKINGIAEYRINKLHFAELERQVEAGRIKYGSYSRESVGSHQIVRVDVFDSSLFEDHKRFFDMNGSDVSGYLLSTDTLMLHLSFFDDTLYSVEIERLSPQFRDAFLKKYGKGKIEVGNALGKQWAYTDCRSCEYCPSKKMRNFDSSNVYKNGKISTMLAKHGICVNSDDNSWECICARYQDIVIKDDDVENVVGILEIYSMQKVRRDSLKRYNDGVDKLMKKF